MTAPPLRTTPLTELHRALGAKLVPFAGYEMPVQFPAGILKEHLQCRSAAALFDVSHMGQAWLISEDGSDPSRALESLVPAELQALAPGRQRYTQLLNEAGGILDDLMVTRPALPHGRERLLLVLNAACKDADLSHIGEALAGRARIKALDDRALLALQGPKSEAVLRAVLGDGPAGLAFMAQMETTWQDAQLWISRSGYTGEDGFEISVPADSAEALAQQLLAQDGVEPAGLGARDSLRLEAGLCLYGQDIDETTTPVEAGLAWSIGKRRRQEGGFAGAETVLRQIEDGPTRMRVGIRPDGRAPARAGTAILDPESDAQIGAITSGGFGPSIEGPVAMGYVPKDRAKPGTEVALSVRGKRLPARIAKLPFVPPGYRRP